MSGVKNITIAADDDGIRIDRWFQRHQPHIKFGPLQKMLRKGEVRLDGGRVKTSTRIAAGQNLRLPPLPEPGEAPPKHYSQRDAEFIRNLIIYQDDEVIALNKPAGLAVQGGSKTHRHIDGMLTSLEKNGERPKLAHRIDRDTSGVLILGKTAAATAELAKAFQSRRMEKTYWAVTNGVPAPADGEVKGYIAKRGGQGPREDMELMVAVRHGEHGGKHARTLYGTHSVAGQKAAWIAMRPLTGRTHQLRLHCQLLGAPIMGDPKYLTDRPIPLGIDNRLHLHARSLLIPREGRPDLYIEAPMPEHMVRSFETFGFDETAAFDVFEDME